MQHSTTSEQKYRILNAQGRYALTAFYPVISQAGWDILTRARPQMSEVHAATYDRAVPILARLHKGIGKFWIHSERAQDGHDPAVLAAVIQDQKNKTYKLPPSSRLPAWGAVIPLSFRDRRYGNAELVSSTDTEALGWLALLDFLPFDDEQNDCSEWEELLNHHNLSVGSINYPANWPAGPQNQTPVILKQRHRWTFEPVDPPQDPEGCGAYAVFQPDRDSWLSCHPEAPWGPLTSAKLFETATLAASASGGGLVVRVGLRVERLVNPEQRERWPQGLGRLDAVLAARAAEELEKQVAAAPTAPGRSRL